MRRNCRVSLIAVAIAGIAIVHGAGESFAGEPAREFLQKLREAGYYDTALDYLEQLPASSTAPKELLSMIAYEKGVTLIEASRVARDPAIREKQLNEAQASFKAFIDASARDKSNKLLLAAEKQLGNVLVERARMLVDRAKKGTGSAEQLKTANGLYTDAYKVFGDTQKAIDDKLKQIPPNLVAPKDEKLIELRDQLRIDNLQTQLLAAAIKEESAETLDPKSADYKRTLEAAAKEYGDIYDRYRTRLAGLYARMYQGRSFQKLGNHKEALSYLTELLEEQDAADEVRALKTKTLLLAMKSWSTDSQKKHAEAIDKGTKWLDKVRPNETKEQDWLELRLLLARALKAHADQIKPMNAQLANTELGEARKLAKFVSTSPGEFQKEARQLMADLGASAGGVATSLKPKNFSEAFEGGKEVIDNMKSAQLILQTFPARLSAEMDGATKADLQKQLAEAKKAVAEAPPEALRLFRTALRFANDDTDVGQLNLVQYYLCYLSYLDNNYYDAALLGSFVAKRYPQSPGARQCAKIAMAAYVKMFADEQKAQKEKGTPDEQLVAVTQFEADHVIEICEYITKKWPDQPEAEEALNTLIPFMIQNKQLAQAEAYLLKISPESPSRGSAELKTGQAMWGEYLRGMIQVREWETDGPPAGADLAARKKELADLKTRAQKTLSDGVMRMKISGSPNATFASAMLSLAQIYVDTNQTDKAIAELEDPKFGPLTLVTQNDPAVSRPGFPEETLRVALRAYIGSLQNKGADVDKTLAKANSVLDKLKEVVGDDQVGKEKLVKNYFSIARDLKSQIELTESPTAKSALSKGFEQFLAKVGSTASDFQILNWVAETFYGMGEAFDTNQDGTLAPEAKKYYGQAQGAFANILAKSAKQKDFASDTMLIQLKLRSASCKRKLGDYAAAIKDLEDILKTTPMMVNVQIEAAHTYQDWAAISKDPKHYYRAIMGGETKVTGKTDPIIWGWGSLSKKTAGAPAFRDAFLEARLNLARSRYLMGKLQKEKAKQIDMLQSAKQDVKNITIAVKDYGGDAWRARFDRLVREIQRDLGEKQVGLLEFQQVTPVGTSVKN